MMKKLLLCVLCFASCFTMQAHSLSKLSALAVNYFNQTAVTRSASGVTSPSVVCVAGDSVVALFTEPSSRRFVVMASDDSQDGMVLAYGNHMSGTVVPSALKKMMGEYRNSILLQAASAPQPLPKSTFAAVEPLLKDEWHQEAPYNMYCPTYDASANPCMVGCVATAISQVMRYYQYPAALQDTLYGWQTEHYELQTVMPGAPIRWDDVLDKYNGTSTFEQQDAVAKLSLYCGMLCKMNYGLNASGADVEDAVEPLQRVMGYDDVRCYNSSNYTFSNWERLLQQELQAHRPVVFAGFNVEKSGHAYVVDGCDAEGLYHVNWGYGGECNGYFTLPDMNAFTYSGALHYNDHLEGFMAFQQMLMMHPTPVELTQQVDTIHLHEVVEQIDVVSYAWGRQPDTNGFTPLQLTLQNNGSDSLNCSMIMVAWPLVYDSLTQKMVNPSDSIILNETGRALSYHHVPLSPKQNTATHTYVKFVQDGCCGFGIMVENERLFHLGTVEVRKTLPAVLQFAPSKPIAITDTSACFVTEVQNVSNDGWAGNLLTYIVKEPDVADSYRHWTFMNTPPMTVVADTICFNGLKPNTLYTFEVKDKWVTQSRYEFTTTSTGVKDVMKDVDPSAPCILYNAQGVLLRRFERMEMAEQFLNMMCASGVYLLKSGQKVHKVQVK